MTDPFAPPQHEIWCRGCRRVGTRPLEEAERAWIRRLRRAHRRRAAVGLAMAPLAFGLGLAAVMHLAPRQEPAVATVLLTLLLGVAFCLLLARDHLAAARALARDLAGGAAWVFEPPADAPPARDGGDAPGAPEAGGFALLGQSRQVVDLHRRAARILRADVIEVEPHSGSRLYAPLSLEVERRAAGLRFHQRALSGPERIELERVRLGLAAPRIAAPLAAAALVALVALVLAARPWREAGWQRDLGDAVGTVLAIIVCARWLVRYVRSLKLAGRIRQDLETGLIVRADGDSGWGAEFLPISRLLWRVGGAPAGWRDRHRAAERLIGSL